jgi:predicted RNA-binding Zn-ribbon protein involved in translation (DUF1610 family)
MDEDREKPALHLAACDECGSDYAADQSVMAAMCPECAHHIYGYPNCAHSFAAGRCVHCLWDGRTSPYIRSLRSDDGETDPRTGPAA